MNPLNSGAELTRASLGRVAHIGELYDVRDESFSLVSLFKGTSSGDLIRKVEMHQTDYDFKFVEKISDRLELLNVEAAIRVDVLCGLIKIGGCGKYLSEEKKSEKTVSYCVKCQFRTFHEKIFGSPDQYIDKINLDGLQNTKYTHVVSEIQWGANCLMSLEFTFDDVNSKKDIEGRLATDVANLFKPLTSVSGGGKVEVKESSILSGNNLNVRVNADFVPEDGLPTTVEGFREFLKKVPKYLKNLNGGAGKPLTYILTPLTEFRKLTKLESTLNVIAKTIDGSFIFSIVLLFEEIQEVKQKLYDLHQETLANKKYVKEEKRAEVLRYMNELTSKESELRLIISNGWVGVKSGEKELSQLMREMENFKSKNLKLYSYLDYLDSQSSILDKLSDIKLYTQKGILYLGLGEKFETVQRRNLKHKFIVLVTSSELEKADQELSKNTKVYFQSKAMEGDRNTTYVVVDFDYVDDGKTFPNISQVRCMHVEGIEVKSTDLLAEYLDQFESNFARPKAQSPLELCTQKPGNRTPLEIPCPGSQDRTCPSDTVLWKCSICKKPLEYAFDQNFYCACGKSSAFSFDYKCSNSTHVEFISAEQKFVEEALRKLRPLKEMNVVFLGQSGVGKSTFINSIVNYMTYDSLDDTTEKGVICTIPIENVIYDPKTHEEIVVKVGDKRTDEVTEGGSSATQECHTYSFIWKKKYVRIIDTPGLVDCRGVAQDKENMKKIMGHLSYLKELHAVCVLLRANDNRFNVIFSYCMKEFLSHLPRSITKNILFCFTNSRTCIYSPGQGAVTLGKLIDECGLGQELPLGHQNMFSFDNESFLFACSLTYFDSINEEIKDSYRKSWEYSKTETNRLFDTIDSFEPHKLVETLSLYKVRNRILSLSVTLAEISRTIQLNIISYEGLEKQVRESVESIEELKKKLKFPEIHLKTKPLDRPRTVCTNASCIEYVTYKNVDVREIVYTKHCHPECYLKNVTLKTVNNPQLYNCDAMDDDGTCTNCGCNWRQHMHIKESQEKVEELVTDTKIQEDLEKETSEKLAKQKLLDSLSSTVKAYKAEQDTIIKASAKFGRFLMKNAITAYNDSVIEYIQHLIDAEKKKKYRSKEEEKVLKNLETMLGTYKEEVAVLEGVTKKKNGIEENLSVEDVLKLEKSLYELKLTGEDIKKSVDVTWRNTERYNETSINIGAVQPVIKQPGFMSRALEKGKKVAKRLRDFVTS